MNPGAYSSDSTPTSFEFHNCVVCATIYLFGNNYGLANSKFHNCFVFNLWNSSNINVLPASNEAYNCVGYDRNGGSVFSNINQSSNTDLTTDEYNALFKEDTFYELTDEAKATYKGNDDTEVGLYGGVMPYSMSIQTPQITKLNVAQKTTTDGKLNVSIEVTATDE